MAQEKTVKVPEGLKEAVKTNDMDLFMPLWTDVKNVWTHGLAGVDIGTMMIALAIFAGFLMLRQVMGRFIINRLKDFARENGRINEAMFLALLPPAQFIPVILGVYFAGQYLGLEGDGKIFVERVVRTLITFTIFWALHQAIEPISHSMKRLEKVLTPVITVWVFKVVRIIIVFIGVAVMLEIWGIEVGPMLAGLGLFGAAIALGAQDFFKNLIAGFSVISEKNFQPGEWILIDGVAEGTVEDIGFRSTLIRRFDKAPVYVPNSKLTDAIVVNFSRMTHRRIQWSIRVKHETTIEQLKIIRDKTLAFLQERKDDFAQENETGMTVRIEEITDTAISIKVSCFTRTTDYASWMRSKEDLALRIKQIVEDEAEASFAAPPPPVVINVPKNAAEQDEKTEIFMPPAA